MTYANPTRFFRSTLTLGLALVALALPACDQPETGRRSEDGTPAAGGKADVIDAPCESDADCGEGAVCEPGVCLHWCSVDDPDCCEPNACVPMDADENPEDQCTEDGDCGEGGECLPGVCLLFCDVNDPGCCEPNVCVEPMPEPEPEPEPGACSDDSDCGDGEVCEPGLCWFWCSVDDPGCCEPDACVPA